MSGEQRLNSVDRFRKQPGRLVLEEHGHCEVPAGCGGVVLRWRNPHAAVPLTLHLYSPGKAATYIDGQPLVVGRPDLVPGRHVLAFRIEEVDRAAGLLLFAASNEPNRYRRTSPSEVVEQPAKFISAGDGTWKCTLDAPAEEWTSAGFDDSGWQTLVAVPAPQPGNRERGFWQWRECVNAGAVCLGLRPAVAGKGTVWVRKVFDLAAPAPAP